MFKYKTRERLTPALTREMGISCTLLMILAYHFFEGPLQNKHVFVAVFTGVGIWAIFRFLVMPRQVVIE